MRVDGLHTVYGGRLVLPTSGSDSQKHPDHSGTHRQGTTTSFHVGPNFYDNLARKFQKGLTTLRETFTKH
jgi:hypothetical protein